MWSTVAVRQRARKHLKRKPQKIEDGHQSKIVVGVAVVLNSRKNIEHAFELDQLIVEENILIDSVPHILAIQMGCGNFQSCWIGTFKFLRDQIMEVGTKVVKNFIATITFARQYRSDILCRFYFFMPKTISQTMTHLAREEIRPVVFDQ